MPKQGRRGGNGHFARIGQNEKEDAGSSSGDADKFGRFRQNEDRKDNNGESNVLEADSLSESQKDELEEMEQVRRLMEMANGKANENPDDAHGRKMKMNFGENKHGVMIAEDENMFMGKAEAARDDKPKAEPEKFPFAKAEMPVADWAKAEVEKESKDKAEMKKPAENKAAAEKEEAVKMEIEKEMENVKRSIEGVENMDEGKMQGLVERMKKAFENEAFKPKEK